jgi:plasmid stability protein
MAVITIRNVDSSLRRRLRARAAKHDRSMEAEARSILAEGLAEPDFGLALIALGDAIRDELGGIDLPEPEKHLPRDLALFRRSSSAQT